MSHKEDLSSLWHIPLSVQPFFGSVSLSLCVCRSHSPIARCHTEEGAVTWLLTRHVLQAALPSLFLCVCVCVDTHKDRSPIAWCHTEEGAVAWLLTRHIPQTLCVALLVDRPVWELRATVHTEVFLSNVSMRELLLPFLLWHKRRDGRTESVDIEALTEKE